MILIADSSALVALSIVNKLDVLEELFGDVYVPRAVYDEIRRENKAESYELANYCKDRVLDIQSSANFNVSLGKGESEAIVLYSEKGADFLLCDDKKAKKFAQSFGLKVIGSLGILLKAKKAKLINEIAPLIEILKGSKIFIDDKTYNLVLKMAEED
jgi:predicted nucleic acid-binding protein